MTLVRRRRWRISTFAVVVSTAVTQTALAMPARADWVRDQQWYLSTLDIPKVHAVNRGKGIIVSVIDSGVDASHPDLVGKVLRGVDLTSKAPANASGQVDIDGHGTALAGLIVGGNHRPGVGVLGVSPDATVLPIRMSTKGPDYTGVSLSEGVRWAVSHGAQVLCMALVSASPDSALRDAIEEAIRADVVVVAAVGNAPEDSEANYPAAFPGVIAAGGLDREERHAAISVKSPTVVLSAPAVDIISTITKGRYGQGSGTSNATAIIAGAAALVRSKYPTMSATEVIHRLTATATDKGPPGRDDEYGYGALNLLAALTADVPPLATTPPTATAAPPPIDDDGPGPGLPLLVLLGGCALLTATVAAAAVFLLRRRS